MGLLYIAIGGSVGEGWLEPQPDFLSFPLSAVQTVSEGAWAGRFRQYNRDGGKGNRVLWRFRFIAQCA